MVGCASKCCVLIVLQLVHHSVQTPIVVEEIDFDDPWDYKVQPNYEPILKTTSKHHSMPSPFKRTRKIQDTYSEDDYDLQSLGGRAKAAHSRLTCPACRLGVSLLRAEVEKNSSVEEIGEKFVSICVGLKIETEPVCAGIFDIYGKVVLPALKMCDMDSEKICSLLLGELCGLVENPRHEWYIELSEKPDYNIWDSPPPSEESPTFKVLQLSDTHFDPQYVDGSPANCIEPLCCRSYSTPVDDEPVLPAGRWGSYGKCDAPKALIENILDNIATQHPDIDYIIWTGDIPPHDIWNQTREQNIENMRFTIGKLLEKFPNTPIFPALGNHEGIPAGNFPPPWVKSDNQSINWLYNVIADEWSKWLPEGVNSTLLHGGFYSVLVSPKFRIIALNTNYCHALSWWLVLNSTDPAKELKWLVYELEMAEQNNEKVHIIGHIPPGATDCLKIWSKNYYDIINRFSNIVVAQFFGHTHNDEFEVFYNDFRMPSAIAYIGPSVTTFEHVNPAYRIYYVDGDHENTTREVLDHETWIMDLAKANEHPEAEPDWFRLYSARTAYNMTNLRPFEWGRLVDLMVTDTKLFDKFYRFLYHASPTRPPCDDNKCRVRTICDLKSGKSHDRLSLCHQEEEILLPRHH